MGVYAVGDVQGCHADLRRLLERLRFDPARDRLLLTGDLVNRGNDSLGVLRLVRSLGAAAVTILGNHDLHLLAVARTGAPTRKRDTLDAVLEAPDADELLAWLRAQPLAWREPQTGVLMVHAGLPPQWDADRCLALAAEASRLIAGPDGDAFLAQMYGDEPSQWREDLAGADRHRFVVNCLTRMRYCRADGRIDLRHKGPPGSQPPDLLPWYAVPGRASAGTRIVFGHWSTLGAAPLQDGAPWREDTLCLDSGCVWGGRLTAIDLLDGRIVAEPCRG